MNKRTRALKERFFPADQHPYRIFEREVEANLSPHHTLLDAGCGRTAPVLARFRGKANRLIGLDVVDFTTDVEGVELIQSDLGRPVLPDACVDIIMARSVMEHIEHPKEAFDELHRMLRPGGKLVFLTANLWDYASLIARIVPNRFHPWIVARTEGRAEEDTFPIQYKVNTRTAIEGIARETGFKIERFEYLGQYPAYFNFNVVLFALGTLYEKAIGTIHVLHFLRGWIICTMIKEG